jgi:hypothetical protein
MGLSRLENFLKSARGTILYVDPNSLDSTDSIENSGNSLTRPFKTLQRALIESARFSYQRGLNNDRFNKTTILLYPGDHIVDNRPGWIPTSAGTYSARSGLTGLTDITQWDLDTRFDLTNPDNPLYKLNSIHGGIIIPRGTSIVGMDLRKTKIRPLYVPDPENDNIERSAIFRTTGACYFWQFTILDADPNGNCYKNYNPDLFVPNFSHHKLAGFEYADGVNPVDINDDFLTYSTTRTDLDMYYEKVAAVYGASSGREIAPDYDGGTSVVDIQPVIDEYRIVGPKGASVGISSIKSGNGDGTGTLTTITVDLVETIEGLSVDSPIQISGISVDGYDGQYVIATVPNSTRITYKVQNAPTNPLPTPTGATLNLVVDTVTSASPYIFNCSVRSVYGMCGLLADGDKATGFKSMVVAQYTGIGLQKDENAFVKYNTTSGEYQYSNTLANLNTDSRSRFRPEYENFHIKATNDAFLQLVSVFAIGYAQHFATENGGDIALNNSNSNFGAKSLVSTGFKREAFSQDDGGYITHIVPPKEIEDAEISVEFSAIDVGVTTSKSVGAGTTSHLYLYNETNQNIPPKVLIDNYHIGAKQDDRLNIQYFSGGSLVSSSSRIVMPYGPYNSTQSSSEKIFTVLRTPVGINSINANTLTLTEPHSFSNGESIRIIAEDGHLPDGLNANQIYYVITKESATGIGTDEIRIAKTLSNAVNGSDTTNAIDINNKGGTLSIVSRVSDKNPGDIGHPVQWDSGGQWYITVDTTDNEIYTTINSSGVSGLGNATTRSYVTRKPDSRSLIDTLYRVRYVIPKSSSTTARPPIDGFILQESNNIIGTGTNEISQLYNNSGSISNSTLLRNPKFIANASYSSGTVTIRAELPHNLKVGEEVEIVNVSPVGYNGTYTVTSILSAKEFTYNVTTSLGSFTNDTSVRTSSLPYFRKKKYNKTYQVYRTQEIQPYIANVQDGIYYLTLINHSNNPTVTPFRNESFAQPIENLYPQLNNDNPDSDPDASVSHALPDVIGKVVIDDPQKSITKETLESFVVGYGITNIRSSSGTAHTIYTSVDHGLSGITTVSIVSGGSNYGSSGSFTGNLYNARLVGFAGSTTGTNATARITITSGAITGVQIIDGGSAYGIGNTLTVVGVATTTSHVVGVVRVESISDNIGDTFKISGVSSASYSGYNTIYSVSGITTGKSKEINVISGETISGFSTVGLGSTVTAASGYVFSGKSLLVSSLTYNSITGLATVGFTTSHGFGVDNKICIRGANETAFNGDFIVKSINSSVGISSIVVNIGIGATTSASATGTLNAYRPTLTSYGGELNRETENTSGRLDYQYAGITTTLGNTVTPVLNLDTNDSNYLIIPNAVSLGLKFGDYLVVNNEIFRVRKNVSSNSVNVFRALLGSPRQNHLTGSVVRRIKVTPVELRRNSIIRASGHTFEYLGFGPGNYSTSLPDKQNRSLSKTEVFLAQSVKSNGGIVVYTGMNSDGDFFAGNKKINSATGKEETFDTPIPTNTGEKNTSEIFNITDTQKLFVENSIKVEGGSDKNIVSEFDGPVVFNNKVTTNSDIEANSLYLQGDEDISRKFSITDTEPTISGNYGDIVFNSEPSKYEFIGWTYVTENKWEPFGWIGDQGVGISSAGNYVGFATLIDLVTSGINLGVDYDSISGISTLTFDANPRVAISSGVFNTFVGFATQINFVGYGVTVETTYNSSGIATVSIISSGLVGGGSTGPGLANKSIQYNNSGSFGGVSIFTYNDVDNNLLIAGSSTSPILKVTQTGTGDCLVVEDQNSDTTTFVVTNNGAVGIGSSVPTAKVDINAEGAQAINIRSTLGSGNIIRIDDTGNDTSPLVYTASGSLGLGTATPNEKLDTIGNIGLNGALRLYNTGRTAYSALQAPSSPGNLTFTLPNSYGSSGQVLTSNGSGTLSWTTVSGGGGTGTISNIGAGTGISVSGGTGPSATITNTGIIDIVAGANVSIVKSAGIATISAVGGGGAVTIQNYTGAMYPFTTRGFSMPI